MEISEALQNIGLNEKQAAVYVALLERGKASAYSIASKSGLKKPTTYVILDELIKKGLARKIPRAGKQMYAPEPPEEVFALAEERLKLAQTTLPKLKALSKGVETKVNAVYYEGIEGVKQALEHNIKQERGKELVGFYATEEGPEELKKFFKDTWAPYLKKHAISVRGIAPEHPSLSSYRKSDQEFNRSFKAVPVDSYSSTISLDTIGDSVRIADYKNLQALIIENPEVAKTVREIFEMVWKSEK